MPRHPVEQADCHALSGPGERDQKSGMELFSLGGLPTITEHAPIDLAACPRQDSALLAYLFAGNNLSRPPGSDCTQNISISPCNEFFPFCTIPTWNDGILLKMRQLALCCLSQSHWLWCKAWLFRENPPIPS